MNLHDHERLEPDLRADAARLGLGFELVPCAFPILREAAVQWSEAKKRLWQEQEESG